MLLHEFPDLQWLKKQAEDRFADRKGWGGKTLENQGWPNVILNASSAHTYRDNIRGPLSIFTNIAGKSIVSCGNKQVVIHEGFFYVTNHDQHYTLQIDNTQTETFNIHFGEYFADQAWRSINLDPEKLLDEQYFVTPGERLELYNKLHQRDHTVDRIICELQEVKNDRLLEEEKLYQLLIHLLKINQLTKKIETEAPALKNSTRKEISKRLFAATDYIHSYPDKDISLDDLASVSNLSKFHFLRLFKIAFKQTPHQFLTAVKLDKAKILLKTSDLEINTIAKSIGFENPSSFSRAFYNRLKIYPSQFRNGL